MAKKQVKVVDAPGYRVCPECLSGALLDMDYYLYCPTEDPHPGGVVVYNDGRVVRADRHLAHEGGHRMTSASLPC